MESAVLLFGKNFGFGELDPMIAKWIYVVSFILAALGIMVGIGVYFAPDSLLPGNDFTSPPTKILAFLWASRQIAIALAIGWALIKKSPFILQVVLSIYALVTAQDVFIGLFGGDIGMGAISAVFCLIALLMLWTLRKTLKQDAH